MNTLSSYDGTTIAYDKAGEGPAVILVDGALSVYRAQIQRHDLCSLAAERPTRKISDQVSGLA